MIREDYASIGRGGEVFKGRLPFRSGLALHKIMDPEISMAKGRPARAARRGRAPGAAWRLGLLCLTVLWVALAALVKEGHDPAKLVGRVYAANTVGAIIGSLVTSLVLVAAIRPH